MVYGVGDARLAENLKLNELQTKEFRARFERNYPQLIRYVADCKQRCRRLGYVQTMQGRRRRLPEIDSVHPAERASGERKAINSTIQGTAADLVKLAMLRVRRALRVEAIPARMLLQMHDELLFEVRQGDGWLERLVRLLNREMPAAANRLPVDFPVRIKAGPSWSQLRDLDSAQS